MSLRALQVSSVLALASLLSSSSALPSPRGPKSRALHRRQDIIAYPGEGGACTHEFGYVNFDTQNDEDMAIARALHDGFCLGFAQMVSYGNAAVADDDRTLFSRYFPDDEEERETVSGIYTFLVNVDDNVPNEVMWDMIVDRTDFTGACGENPSLGGYMDVDENDNLEKFHLCDAAFENPSVPSDIECGDLSDVPDVEMESVARLILHEVLHNSQVTDNGGAGQITDTTNSDGLSAYYPQRTHALVEENEGLAVANADSYAWLAINAYYKYACTNVGETPPNNGNFNEPAGYTAGQPGDS